MSIISFANVIGVSAGVASASSSLVFSLTTGIIKNLLKITKNKKKKYNKTFWLPQKQIKWH